MITTIKDFRRVNVNESARQFKHELFFQYAFDDNKKIPQEFKLILNNIKFLFQKLNIKFIENIIPVDDYYSIEFLFTCFSDIVHNTILPQIEKILIPIKNEFYVYDFVSEDKSLNFTKYNDAIYSKKRKLVK